MGFSLGNFFEELIEQLEALEKGQTTVESLLDDVKWYQQYAKECGKT